MIGWWPPAAGWWLVLAVALLALFAGAWWLYRRRQRSAYRRLGLRRLDSIQRQYERDLDARQAARDVNALLKGVALKAYPRRDIAAISGDAWHEFLSASAPTGQAFERGSLTAQYRPEAGDIDVDALVQAARHWICRHEATQ